MLDAAVIATMAKQKSLQKAINHSLIYKKTKKESKRKTKIKKIKNRTGNGYVGFFIKRCPLGHWRCDFRPGPTALPQNTSWARKWLLEDRIKLKWFLPLNRLTQFYFNLSEIGSEFSHHLLKQEHEKK